MSSNEPVVNVSHPASHDMPQDKSSVALSWIHIALRCCVSRFDIPAESRDIDSDVSYRNINRQDHLGIRLEDEVQTAPCRPYLCLHQGQAQSDRDALRVDRGGKGSRDRIRWPTAARSVGRKRESPSLRLHRSWLSHPPTRP